MLAKSFIARQNDYRAALFTFICILLVFSSTTLQAQQRKPGLSARLVNIESVVKDPFRFNLQLHNGSSQPQLFSLKAELPDGWTTTFRADGNQVAAIRVDSAKTQDITAEFLAVPFTKPGKYNITVTATSNTETFRVELEAVVKGSYAVEVSTPSGRLSDEITEGSSKTIQLTVKNTGTLPLDGLELSAHTPTQWSASFQPAKIERLEPGATQEVDASLSVPNKTIAGDYVTTFTAKNNFASANASFRMTVKTSVLSGWIGILVILAALGLVYYLIRKYGRR